MNNIGPGSDDSDTSVPSAAIIPDYWKRFGPLVKQNAWSALPIVGDVVAPVHGISYSNRGTTVVYGINKHGTSFIDRGTDIAMGNSPKGDEIDAALHLAAGRFGEPLLLTGTDRFKGAVLERAISRNIAIGNPEMQTLQAILRRQRNPMRATRHETRTTNAQTTVAPMPQQRHKIDPIIEPVAGDNSATFAVVVHGLVDREFPNKARSTDALPDPHRENEVRLYDVIAASDKQIAIDYGDGSYTLVNRSRLTEETQPGDSVEVTSNSERNIALVRPYIDLVVRQSSNFDPDAALQQIDAVNGDAVGQRPQSLADDTNQPTRIDTTVPTDSAARDASSLPHANSEHPRLEAPGMNDFTRELLTTKLVTEGRIALGEHGISTNKMHVVPFAFPTRPTTYTVLAANDAGVLLHRGFGTMMIVEAGKISMPRVAAKDKLPFRLVNGTMQAASPASIAPKVRTKVAV